METINNLVNYENAFNCSECPGTNGPKGCPLWWEYTQENDKGETRLVKTCGLPQLPYFLHHLITASNRPAQEFGKMGNQIVEAIKELDKTHEQRISMIQDQRGKSHGG